MKEHLFLFEAAFLKDNYVFVEHGLDKKYKFEIRV